MEAQRTPTVAVVTGANQGIGASAFGSVRNLAPELHKHFDTDTMTLDEVDAVMLHYADLVEAGRDRDQGWPESINVPSKIGQVAATRVFARERADIARDGGMSARSALVWSTPTPPGRGSATCPRRRRPRRRPGTSYGWLSIRSIRGSSVSSSSTAS
jgi:hypothetical protein